MEFIINGDDSIKSILKERKFEIFKWIEEKEQLLQALKQTDVVIVDSYLAGVEVYKNISDNARIPVYLDDNCRIDYPAGIVINWNIYATDLDYPQKDDVSYLLGTGYILLRKAFWDVTERKTKEKVTDVMVTFGGDDSKNLTPRVLSFLTEEYPWLKKNVIIGNAFKNFGEIKTAADVNTRFIHSPDDRGMKDIISGSDVAISSGGQTLYELACVGVPTVAVAVADNQRNNVIGWKKTAFCVNAGFWTDKDLMDNIAEGLQGFMNNSFIRSQSSKIGQSHIKCGGADRVIQFLQCRISN